MARGAIGMSGEVGDLAQSLGGDKVGGDGEKVGPWWGSVEELDGVELGVGIHGVVLVLVALSICLIFSVLGLYPKQDLGTRMSDVNFHCSLPCSQVFTSTCRVVLGPSHLRKFHHRLNSEFGTGCVIWRLLTFVSFRHLRCGITSPIWVSCGTLHMHIVILQSRFEKVGSQDYCCSCFFCFCFCCCYCFGCWYCYSAAASVAVTLLFRLQIRWAL